MVQNPTDAPSEVQVAISADDEASGVIDSVTQKLDGLGRKAAAVAGGGIAALGGALAVDAVKAAASFEDAIVDLQKVAGEDVAQGLKDDIQEMAEEIPLTAEELAGLSEDAARFGIEGEENIQQFVESTAKMSTATQLNTNQAGEAMSKLAELTNTPVSEVENLGSAINSLSNTAATSSQEIVDASLRSAGSLSQLGLSQTEIFGLNTALNEVSESSERSGTRLRRFAQEIQNTDPSALAEPLGLTVDEFATMRDEEPAALMQLIAEKMANSEAAADTLREELSTTSQQAISGLAQNLDGLRSAMELSQDSFEEATSLQEEFNQETSKSSTQLQLLRSKFNNIQRSLGEDMLPALNKLLDFVSDSVEAFGDLNEQTDGLAAQVAVAGSVVGGLTTAIAALGGGGAIASAVASIGGLGASIAALANPIGIAVAAIAGLAIAFDRHGEEIMNVIDTVVPHLQDAFDEAIRFIRDEAPELFGNAMEAVGTGIRRGLKDMTNPLKGEDSTIWSLYVDAMKWQIKNMPKLFVAVGQAVIDAIVEGVKGLFKGLVGNSVLKDELNKAAGWARRNVGDIFSGIGSNIVDTIASGVKGGADILTGALEGTLNTAANAVDLSGGGGDGGGGGARNGPENAGEKLNKEVAKGIYQSTTFVRDAARESFGEFLREQRKATQATGDNLDKLEADARDNSSQWNTWERNISEMEGSVTNSFELMKQDGQLMFAELTNKAHAWADTLGRVETVTATAVDNMTKKIREAQMSMGGMLGGGPSFGDGGGGGTDIAGRDVIAEALGIEGDTQVAQASREISDIVQSAGGTFEARRQIRRQFRDRIADDRFLEGDFGRELANAAQGNQNFSFDDIMTPQSDVSRAQFEYLYGGRGPDGAQQQVRDGLDDSRTLTSMERHLQAIERAMSRGTAGPGAVPRR